jgi:arabinogalactan endo-1,4-beta-galactosidase
MIHYAGVKATDTDCFFNKMKSVDYDYITVVLSNLAWKRFRSCKNQAINTLGKHSIKKVVIAETAYPLR